MHFTDNNPYQSPPIIATLVERPARQRHPWLAVVFLILDAPFLLVQVACLSSSIAKGQWSEIDPIALFFGLFAGLVVSIPIWWIAFIAVRELVQYARGQ